MGDLLALLAFYIVYFVILFSVILLVGIASYILQGIALQRLATKCGLPRPWLGWVPFGNYYTVGAISDHHHERNYGSDTHSRNGLLRLGIASTSLLVGGYLFLLAALIPAIIIARAGEDDHAAFGIVMILLMVVALLVFLAALVVALVLTIKLNIRYYIALHRVYRLFAPNLSTLFLLLSILVAPPAIFLLIISNRDPVYVNFTPTDRGYGGFNDTVYPGGGYAAPNGGYTDPNGGYTDPNGGYTDPNGGYAGANGAYGDTYDYNQAFINYTAPWGGPEVAYGAPAETGVEAPVEPPIETPAEPSATDETR